MHDPRTLNGQPNWPPPSLTDIVLGEIRTTLRDIQMEQRETREDLGGLKAGQAMMLTAQRESFYKADKAHERITRVQEEVSHLRSRLDRMPASSGPPPTPHPGSLAAATAFTRALAGALPSLREALLALVMLLGALGLLLNPPTTGSTTSGRVPPPAATTSHP